MAGNADKWLRQMYFGVKAANLSGGKLARMSGKVNSVSPGGKSHVRAGVDEELCRGVADGFENIAGERRQVGCGEVFFAQLNEIDAVGGPASGLADEGGPLERVVAGK
jgi:hypothetical protein